MQKTLIPAGCSFPLVYAYLFIVINFFYYDTFDTCLGPNIFIQFFKTFFFQVMKK